MRRRLDAELVARGLAQSRGHAQELIVSRRVTVAGAHALKAARQVSPGEPIIVLGPPPKFVSRAGQKLEEALKTFGIDASGACAIDVGSSTGGFTDCLLQHGAASVLSVDVGTNQLHERLRADGRVTVMENTNIRSLQLDNFAEDDPRSAGFDMLVADLSFTSTRSMLTHFATLLNKKGNAAVLVKPQFEAGRKEVSKGRGIIRDKAIWERVLHEFIDGAIDAGLEVTGLAISPVTGGKGNVEFLAHVVHQDILG